MSASAGKTKVLFVCYANMIRSQMAEAFARELASAFLEIYSAGIHPTGLVSPEAVMVMREKGIDLSKQRSKGLGDVPVAEMDYIVNLSGYPSDAIRPESFDGEIIEWQVGDPVGKPAEYYRSTRDTIEQMVQGFVQKMWKQGSTREGG
jgi:arsenate reductase